MADHPILFSGPMVRANNEDRKTQTRRIAKLPDVTAPVIDFVKVLQDKKTGRDVYEMKDATGKHVSIRAGKRIMTPHFSPPYAVGDRLWVRETWRCNSWADDVATIFYGANERDSYTAMCEQHPVEGKKHIRPSQAWRPSIHMPRWISRTTLIVEAVRIERLQDISEEDAAAEGWPNPAGRAKTGIAEIRDAYPIGWYAGLWESINGPGSWGANPWVIAYTYRVIRRNIDQIDAADSPDARP